MRKLPSKSRIKIKGFIFQAILDKLCISTLPILLLKQCFPTFFTHDAPSDPASLSLSGCPKGQGDQYLYSPKFSVYENLRAWFLSGVRIRDCCTSAEKLICFHWMDTELVSDYISLFTLTAGKLRVKPVAYNKVHETLWPVLYVTSAVSLSLLISIFIYFYLPVAVCMSVNCHRIVLGFVCAFVHVLPAG